MVNRRREIQEAHERFVVGLFLDYFNRCYHTDFKVVDEPNLPDAIIKSKKSVRWVEVTTAYLSKEFAIDLNSYATKDEIYKPIEQGLLVEPDAKFAAQFVGVIKQKLEKSTYEPIREEYGQGYLVVSIQYPLFDARTLSYIRSLWDQIQLNNTNCFKSIYIVYRTYNGCKISRWKY